MTLLPTRMKIKLKNEVARVVTLYSYILDAQWQLALWLVFGCGQKSNSFVAFMVALVTCKNEEDPFKNEGARVVTRDLPL